MQLTRLRLAGFKTFVEPTEFPIEPGLTGIVGPNGCGKSNLVEALRWVMGESSFKNMRGAGMDDVIFAGSAERPARNMAEVALTLDNADRKAPSAFNDSDVLEVTRRIERAEGSTYRVNGKEVRARDVQLLFADAATGARSPALVRQGQISDLIAARPQSRRRILEDAAGIAGLYSRRHEAELRLRGAEDNLTRLEDVLTAIDGQLDSLQRQARQAGRYRTVAAEIRRAEAVLALIAEAEARSQRETARRLLDEASAAMEQRNAAQADAARLQAIAAHAMPGLREADAAAAAALVRLQRGLDEIEAENRRAKRRVEELAKRLSELATDREAQARLGTDAADSLARLAAEDDALAREAQAGAESDEDIAATLTAAEAALAQSEAAHGALQTRLAEQAARRAAVEKTLRDAGERERRSATELAQVEAEAASLTAEGGGKGFAALREAVATATLALAEADAAAAAARSTVAAARDEETRRRAPLAQADRAMQRLETEIATLRKLLAPAPGQGGHALLDDVSTGKGLETALGAVLGDDLDASDDAAAPVHWRDTGLGDEDPPLPAGAEPLSEYVRAPALLLRRLRQIGLVARADGERLSGGLRPGQRLVSREGDVWRWDGFTSAAEAPSAAARRLAERNRLAELEALAEQARGALARAGEALAEATARSKDATAAEAAALESVRGARAGLDRAREALALAERQDARLSARRSALAEASGRLGRAIAVIRAEIAQAEGERQALAAAPALDAAMLAARADLAERRQAASEARARMQTRARESELRADRRAAIAREIAAWRQRAAGSAEATTQITTRIAEATEEHTRLLGAPDTYLVERRRLLAAIEAAETARMQAAARLAEGEAAQAQADGQARAALDALSAAREARAGAEARLEAAAQRLATVLQRIAEDLDSDVAGLRPMAALRADEPLPQADEVERRLAGLKAERDRLGAVNLRAEDELAEIQGRRSGLSAERDDLTEAIRRLRHAIGALNREGRERLLAAFEIVDGHFRHLFGVLFGGGTAELSLVDSDDPLEAGLEIIARPPGKKPQVMTLLSGGEQALTATALIFAVFLTNPSPICVLDEVDAPLDDANVERYCDLLDEMARSTATRFILITHNPITMARMDRLFGVTMAERGVSQMVSVDLATAERIREVA
ncbi:AAA family ATPase [Bosea sp. TWI1241]|uniref:chromosome segregation SMC family protein n=1 Tax=Bosea sp. TWI1241 TaxID=3148904 RepID=UPI003207F9E5